MKQFVDYIMGLYGEGERYDIQATRQEVWKATCIRIKNNADNPLNGISCEIDSLDHQAVRDIVLDMKAGLIA